MLSRQWHCPEVFSLHVLRALDKTQIVLEEILKRPRLEKSRFSKVKRQIEQELKSTFDDSDQLAHFHLRQAVFDKSPGNLLSTGSPESIASIQDEQVRNYWHRNLNAGGLRMFMVAAMDDSSIVKSFDNILPNGTSDTNFINELPFIEPETNSTKFVLKMRRPVLLWGILALGGGRKITPVYA